MSVCFGSVFIFLLSVIVYVGTESPPIVETSYGKVQGDFIVAKDGTKYEAFMGVPYAKPPVRELRFETNVNQTELLDVIVYIHGGSFMFYGSRNYKSVELIKKNFILVTFNYRLGPLGFLSTDDEVVPGNMGLKDQVAALQWVQKNIRYFGGNSSSVTISGMSAGGASVNYHMLSPLSKGLFQKAISHSGVAVNPWALSEAGQEKAKKLAASLQCPTDNNTAMISCLKSVPGNDIVQRVPLFQEFLYSPFSPFGPVVEPDNAQNTFLTEYPWIALVNTTSKVPWLVSFTSAEGLYPGAEFIENQDFLKKLDKNWNAMAPHLLDYNYTAPVIMKDDISNRIRNLYFPNNITINESPNQLIKLLSERHFESGIAIGLAKYIFYNVCNRDDAIENGLRYREFCGSTTLPQVYVYKFGYSGNFTGAKVFNISDTNYGVNHGDDLLYIFDNKMFDKFATDKDKEMQKRMIHMYDSFIRKRVPEFFDDSPMHPVSMNDRGMAILDINAPDNATSIQMEHPPANLIFWKNLPLNEMKFDLDNLLSGT
ncbi:venom carboxylesterase-6 isoform X2 [Nilaparvata lugens]|uniref:venom carboxylesterase-6 isoform X2 n=1 Tax=Nilaparvata lugens TaxID=108931 RepID=UPI00193E667F|nr:venom carboxylesterase-6 isoform X2 [Nilaparvata lugens]